MKKMFRLLVMVPVIAMFVAAPLYAGDAPPYPSQGEEENAYYDDPPPGELILVDALVARPIGFAACLVGMVGAALVYPFGVTSNTTDVVGKQLVEKPFDYTFRRPLGDMGD